MSVVAAAIFMVDGVVVGVCVRGECLYIGDYIGAMTG
jgi:hypothetical protein